MSENRFKIVFDGALLPGVDATTARLNLAALFKSDVGAVERLFTGQPVALKRDLSQADAQTYLQALTKTGIDARIEAEPTLELNLSDVQAHIPVNAPPAMADPESPYAPPRAAVGEAVPEFGTLKAFTVEGRIGRLRYLAWMMTLMLVLMGVTGVFVSIGFSLLALTSTIGLVIGGLLGALVCVAFAVVGIQISVQRLHDLGWSGWLYLLTLVPFVGSLFPFVLMVAPGNATANRYGAPPPPNSTGVKILSSIGVLFFVFVFLGALTGGIDALQSKFASVIGNNYESGTMTTDEVEAEPADDTVEAPNSPDDAAEPAQPPVDSAKE